MKLSVSAFRAQASAQRKILSSYQNQLNYGACTSFPTLGGYASEDKPQVMVDSTAINPINPTTPHQQPPSSDHSRPPDHHSDTINMDEQQTTSDPVPALLKRHPTTFLDKSPARTRSKSNQRWMKLRTTVQLSGAINSTTQKSKGPLKREDSFLKRFSTRQIPETQETMDTGDETETHNGSQAQNEVNRRRRRRRKEMSKTVVNPDENFYFYWLMTVTVCVLYNLWTLIVRQSFPELQRAASAFWYSGDGFADIVFVCDIAVQFRTGYLEQGLMVYNSKKLATHYLKSRAFLLDTLSLLPLDFLQVNIGINPLLRFPRFLKVYRVYNYYYMVESRTVYPNLWRVVNLIHILLILAHWFGCFYYLLSEAEGFHGDWVYPHRPGDYATLTRKYLASLYWSTLTLTTIGDLPTPETNAESRGRSKAMTSSGQSEAIPRRGHKSRLLQFNSNCGYLFTIVSYLIGVFIFATIVGQVGNVITNRNANRLEFERLLDGAKTYMRHHKVPGGMKRRVLRWYDYSWSRGRIQGGGDINTALGLLPDKLKTELALHVNLSVLKKVTIFQECQPEFLHDLVLKMKAYIFTPGDLICRKGEVAREMFIIADGILDVISETGRVLTTMKAGDFFGEIGILNLDGLNKRTADVRSVGYSELFSLSREDVLSAMKDYPEAQEILQSLGRRRLMEAKNAAKLHKAQVRQSKDRDSSGDSDTAGKRIVEKLRSDVKGLKKALRRSRRGTRTKGVIDGPAENSHEKTSAKKQSILRRMSHVQSSDECETTLDQEQTPIGAGLPLLHRLKLLKEKQENEAEEKERLRLYGTVEGSPRKRSEVSQVGSSACLSQGLMLVKQKEVKGGTAPGSAGVPSTVRTQVTGCRSEGAAGKRSSGSSSCPRDGGQVVEEETKEEKSPLEGRVRVGIETGRNLLKERVKVTDGDEARGKNLGSGAVEGEEGSRKPISKSGLVNMARALEADKSVPKLVRNILEVPMSKGGWKLVNKSSVSSSRWERKLGVGEDKVVRKVSKKGTYLSKSDTVLERQKSIQKEGEKRSRSMSPSRKRAVEDSEEVGERRRSKSVGHSPKGGEFEGGIGRRQFLISSSSEVPDFPRGHSDENSPRRMKKYNSISDLSPEYSGLPFVKKLKILNERQKLEELEKELVVRSVSLDVSEGTRLKPEKMLVRSRSEASTGECTSAEAPELRSAVVKRLDAESEWCRARATPNAEYRNSTGDDKRCERWMWRCSGGSIASPESNETLERRHLKSILKKLSGEEITSDENKTLRNLQRGCSSSRREESTELRKLMREPTIEGYAARHKKLTKSVTFDSDTLPSPLDSVLEQPPEEATTRGYSPVSPAAILTLQLSNLSMMPIAGPKKTNKSEGRTTEGEKYEKFREMTHPQEEGLPFPNLPSLQNTPPSEHGLLMPSSFQEFTQKKLVVLPSTDRHDQFFSQVQGEILHVVRQLLDKAHGKFESQLNSLQAEVNKRDEIIAHLQSKLLDLERKYREKKLQSDDKAEEAFEKNSESSAEESDLSDVTSEHLQRKRLREAEWYVGGRRTREEFGDGMSPGGSPEKRSSASGRFSIVRVGEEMRSEWGENVWTVRQTNGEAEEFVGGGGERKCLERSCEEEGREMSESGKWLGGKEDGGELKGGVGESLMGEGRRRADKVGKGIIGESGSKGSFMNRVSKLQKSRSSCQEKKAEFVALNIDGSSNSSDVENVDGKDWEVQMLVEELAKKDPYWRAEERWESDLEGDLGHLEDVKKLQEEVDTLKRVVCDGDLSKLTSSELDILESIIEANDQKILQISKSSSLDNERKNVLGKAAVSSVGPSGGENKTKESGQSKKSLKHKIGQALSFDFHDMESRKPKLPKNIRHRRLCSKAQKTISGHHRKHQSLYNLWRTSTRLRNRVLDDSDRITPTLSVSGSITASSRSSLPILISTSPDQGNSPAFRTSLPLLSAKDFTPNFCECLTSPAIPCHSSSTSLEEAHQVCQLDRTREPALEELPSSPPPDAPHSTASSIIGPVKPNDVHSTNTLNSFIKSVGQKVKQVMAGETTTARSQVPTISKLLQEQSSLKSSEPEVSENMGGSSVVPSPSPTASSKALGSCHPPDL